MLLKHSYSSTLRCLGQALEQRDIVAFELKCENQEFRLRCGGSPDSLALIDLRFSEHDISSLEQQGRAKRGRSSKTSDFNGLPEILRAVGRFVDRKRGSLIGICNVDSATPADDCLKVEYQDYTGQTRVEKLLRASLQDRLTRMYKERS